MVHIRVLVSGTHQSASQWYTSECSSVVHVRVLAGGRVLINGTHQSASQCYTSERWSVVYIRMLVSGMHQGCTANWTRSLSIHHSNPGGLGYKGQLHRSMYRKCSQKHGGDGMIVCFVFFFYSVLCD